MFLACKKLNYLLSNTIKNLTITEPFKLKIKQHCLERNCFLCTIMTKAYKKGENENNDIIVIDLEPPVEACSSHTVQYIKKNESCLGKTDHKNINLYKATGEDGRKCNPSLEIKAHSSNVNSAKSVGFFDDITILHDEANILCRNRTAEKSYLKPETISGLKTEDIGGSNDYLPQKSDRPKNTLSDLDELRHINTNKDSATTKTSPTCKSNKFRYFNIGNGSSVTKNIKRKCKNKSKGSVLRVTSNINKNRKRKLRKLKRKNDEKRHLRNEVNVIAGLSQTCNLTELNVFQKLPPQIKTESTMCTAPAMSKHDFICEEFIKVESLPMKNASHKLSLVSNLTVSQNIKEVHPLPAEENCNGTVDDCSVSSLSLESATPSVQEQLPIGPHPSTSSAQCQRVAEPPKDAIETIDFMQKENISLRDIEYVLPISPLAAETRRIYEKARPMVPTNDATSFLRKTSNFCTFTVLNYNILSQKLLNNNANLYRSCIPEHLSWEYRWHLLQHEIKSLSPNIVTLQEIDETHYITHFLPWLCYYGYKGFYKKRTGNKEDGCAIFYKSDKFTVLEYKSVEFYQSGESILNRDNIGLILKLTPNDFHRPFCVSTTHLLYNPKRSDVRILQMVVLLSELERFCYEGEDGGIVNYCPILLTGDLNSDPNSALLSFLCNSELKYDHLHAKSLEHFYRPGLLVGNQLIPSALGISNYCHHSILDQGRSLDKIRGSLFSPSDKRKMEESLISIGKGKHLSSNVTPDLSNCSGSLGTLYHRFKLTPVYEFNNYNVTTFHKTWTMVDYIFYSKIYSKTGNKLRNGPLRLVAKYQLPDVKVAKEIGAMPCAFCPSDHFPLAARFTLLDDK